MNQRINGNGLHGGPLTLSTPQRVELLKKIGLHQGWMLLSVSEMFDLKKNMDGAAKENARLNKQTARLIAAWISDQERAVAVLNEALAYAKGAAGKEPAALATKIEAALKTFIEPRASGKPEDEENDAAKSD